MKLKALALALTSIAASAQASEISGRVTVVDGDTLSMNGTIVQLYGIEAPLLGTICDLGHGPEDCGLAAMNSLQLTVANQIVTCDIRNSDINDYVESTCSAAGTDLAQAMVAQGWARARRSDTEAYLDHEAAAWIARRGLWRSAGYRTRH